MYNIKAMVPGIFCLNLEDGAINMRPGQMLNIELYCSREWIDTNPEFRSLINRRVIMVCFDSATDTAPKANLMAIPQRSKPANVQPLPAKSVSMSPVQLSKVPEPLSDAEPIVIDLATNAVSQPKKEIVLEPETIVIQDPNKQYSEAEMRKLNLNDLKLLAASLDIKVVPPLSKIRIIKLILKKYEETGVVAVNA